MESAAPPRAFEVQAVSKRYAGAERPANTGIDLAVDEGEIFGLLGPNGAGKTTLIHQMVGLVAPTSGRITCAGRDVATAGTWLTRVIGFMPQSAFALNHLTVGQALYFTGRFRGLSRPDARRERGRHLERWALGPVRDRVARNLSGGQRRLLQLATAMVADPPVLVLDEPTNDLDPGNREVVWQAVRQARSSGTTVVFITHDAREAEKVIDRVGIMREGRLLVTGSPAELKRAVGSRLRLEVATGGPPPPVLAGRPDLVEVQPGRWRVRISPHEVRAVIDALEFGRGDDFQITSPTLEDLYVHYTQGDEVAGSW